MKSFVLNFLASAAAVMWKDGTLGHYTTATKEHENNLKTHYAIALRTWLPWLHYDFDLIKPDRERKRPDFVFHWRDSLRLDFLVGEVKRERDRKGVDADLQKIREDWLSEPLRYRFGASILMLENARGFEVRLIARDNPDIVETATHDDFVFMHPPKLEPDDLARFRELCAAVAFGNVPEGRLDDEIVHLYLDAEE